MHGMHIYYGETYTINSFVKRAIEANELLLCDQPEPLCTVWGSQRHANTLPRLMLIEKNSITHNECIP